VPDDKPGKPDQVTVALYDNDPTMVEVSWEAPDDHHSDIEAYEVRFLTNDGAFVASPHCDGAANATIISGLACQVSMQHLRTLTGLPRDSRIRAIVRATNARGTGAYSEVNTNTLGATIETEPSNMSVVSIDVPSTTNTVTKVVWTPLTGSSRGGKNVEIEKYEIYWDQGTPTEDGSSWVSLTVITGADLA
jgi:hypothetical protein